jgi:hypothetical protein
MLRVASEPKRHTAWIHVPAMRKNNGYFTIMEQFEDFADAKTWLAHQVAKHPDAEEYGVDDIYGQKEHVSGAIQKKR